MRKSFLLIASVATIVAAGCRSLSHEFESYTYRNLELEYPKSMEIVGENESPNESFVSFILNDKADKKSRIEFGISEFPDNFLATVPKEELLGELAAEVDEMIRKVSSAKDVSVLEQSEIQWSEHPSPPEAFSFARVSEEGETIYLAFSAKVVGRYCVCSVCRSGNPSILDLFNNILNTINNP